MIYIDTSFLFDTFFLVSWTTSHPIQVYRQRHGVDSGHWTVVIMNLGLMMKLLLHTTCSPKTRETCISISAMPRARWSHGPHRQIPPWLATCKSKVKSHAAEVSPRTPNAVLSVFPLADAVDLEDSALSLMLVSVLG